MGDPATRPAAVHDRLVLVVAYTALGRYGLALGRYGLFVACLTPIVVLLGSGGSEAAAAQAALDRVALTVAAALIAAALAVALVRTDRADRTDAAPVYDPQT